MGSIEKEIVHRLTEGLVPQEILVVNESHGHNVPKNSETHFKVRLVSAAFEGETLVQRHRKVYQLLAEPMNNGVHALSLELLTPSEAEKQLGSSKSPPCLGGSQSSQ